SSEAEHQLPKLRTRVRFSSPALLYATVLQPVETHSRRGHGWPRFASVFNASYQQRASETRLGLPRILGVHVTTPKAYFAVAEEGAILDGHVERLDVPPAEAGGAQLLEALADLNRRLATSAPDYVAILQGESSFAASDSEFRPRLTFEALVRIAAAE